MAGPLFGSSGTLLSGSAAAASFAVPTSVASGDLVVVVFFLDGAATVTAFPSGFAEAENSPTAVPAGGGQHSLHVVWKRATGADSGTYDFTFSASVYREGAAHRFTGAVGSGTPFDSPTGSAFDAVSGTVTPPVSTTTLGADRLLLFAGTDWSGGTWTPPATYTERMDSGVGLVTLAELAKPTAGSSGSVSATSSSSDKRTGWIGGLIPAAAAVSSRTQPLIVGIQPALPPATPILLRAALPVIPTATPRPVVVAASVAVPASAGILLRRSLVDAPALTTVSPVVVTAAPAQASPAAILARAPQASLAPAAVTAGPLVVSTPVPPGPPAVLLVRSALADPPVLTTAEPYVVTSPGPPPAAAAIQVRNPQPPAVVVSGPTIEPIVVTQPGPPPAAAALVLRATLQDAIVATPAPMVVTAPAPVRLATPVLVRGSLADLLAATEPLIVAAPVAIGRGAALMVRNAPPPFVAGPPGPITAPIVVTTVTGTTQGLAVLLRTRSDFVCDPVTHRPSVGVTTWGGAGTTVRPSTGTTTRPSSCS